MAFSVAALEKRMRLLPVPARYVVLDSGGCDSTVLLHAMAALRARLPARVTALHFDHGLNRNAPAWGQTVVRQAAALGIECLVEALDLDPDGSAAETRARDARRARLREWMRAGDCCLTAHHADDQAETFLLQALRGSGPAGLAAMPAWTRFAAGWIGRPLLDFTRTELRAWAEARALHWIEDPANRVLSSPRNRLRHRVWPEVAAGWPAAARTLGRSAALAGEAADLIEEIAAEDWAKLAGANTDRLPVDGLLALSPARRRALLRHWLRGRGLSVPQAARLRELEREFLERDPGARALWWLHGLEIRRFHGMLHALEPLPEAPRTPIALTPGDYVDLGPLGRIGLIADAAGPLGSAVAAGPAVLRFRHGGERLRPAGAAHRRELKKILQERAVLPWMRGRLPILCVAGEIAAVAGIVVAEGFAGRGWRWDWRSAPAIE